MSRVDPTKAEVVIYSLKRDSVKVSLELDINVANFRDPLGNKPLIKNFNDGRAAVVRDWVKIDPKLTGLLESVALCVHDRVMHAGQKRFVIGFRDIHGVWISPAIAELTADYLDKLGYSVGVIHDGIKGT